MITMIRRSPSGFGPDLRQALPDPLTQVRRGAASESSGQPHDEFLLGGLARVVETCRRRSKGVRGWQVTSKTVLLGREWHKNGNHGSLRSRPSVSTPPVSTGEMTIRDRGALNCRGQLCAFGAFEFGTRRARVAFLGCESQRLSSAQRRRRLAWPQRCP